MINTICKYTHTFIHSANVLLNKNKIIKRILINHLKVAMIISACKIATNIYPFAYYLNYQVLITFIPYIFIFFIYIGIKQFNLKTIHTSKLLNKSSLCKTIHVHCTYSMYTPSYMQCTVCTITINNMVCTSICVCMS